MTLFWTDACLLLVFLLAIVFILWSLRKETTRRMFGRIFEKPFALSSAIILAFFIIIGLLDCIRITSFQVRDNSPNSITILDHLLSPLNKLYERTYSAPLTLNAYTPETIMEPGPNGTMMAKQIRLRLQYPPLEIKTQAMLDGFIQHSIGQAFLLSLLGSILLGFILWLIEKKSHTLHFNKQKLIVGLFTFFVCLFFAIASYKISRYTHLFGTGKIGQDIFYYALKSIRTGLAIGLLTTIFMLPLALFFGIASGYFGGIVDDLIQYLYTTLSSIPGILLITASVLSLQTYMTNHPEKFPTLEAAQDTRLLALCFILGITSWTSLCRLLRAEALKLREMDFVQAAIALGSRRSYILRKHLLPNVLPIVLITVVLDFSFLVLAEALLAYVGVGVSPMTISWGNMINSARLELAKDPIVWWPVVTTFLFMFTLVLSSNLFADAVRDALDPNQAD